MFLPDEAHVILTLPSNSLLSLFITQLEKGQQLQVCQWQEMTAQAGFCSLPQEASNLASLKDNSLSQIIRSLISCLLRGKLLLPFQLEKYSFRNKSSYYTHCLLVFLLQESDLRKDREGPSDRSS